jgi:hypothetical protein
VPEHADHDDLRKDHLPTEGSGRSTNGHIVGRALALWTRPALGNTTVHDIRGHMFGGMGWYEALERPDSGPSAWYEFKAPLGSPGTDFGRERVSAVLHYVNHIDVWDDYKTRLQAVVPKAIQLETAQSRDRSVTAALWEILNEPLAALVLDCGLGWHYVGHDPAGKDGRVGDWLFRTASGVETFVEVKTISEYTRSAGAFDYAPTVWNAVHGAHKQLSRSSATLVVMRDHVTVGFNSRDGLLSPLIEGLYGKEQLTFRIGPDAPADTVQAQFELRKRGLSSLSHLGAVLHLGTNTGSDLQATFYPNEWCEAHAALPSADFAGLRQVHLRLDWDEERARLDAKGDAAAVTWQDTFLRLAEAIAARP